MQKSISNRKIWFWLVAILLLFILLSYFVASPQPKDYPDYVSDSPAPTGIKGIYTYLEEDIDQWSHPPELLPNRDEDNLLIIVEPYFIPETEEMTAYMDFIEAGNTILLFQTNPTGMFDVKTTYVNEPAEQIEVMQEEKQYRVEISSPVRLQANEQDQILISDKLGTIALNRRYGDGNLIVATTPEWMTNQDILKEDHLPLVLSLIDEGKSLDSPILIDEYSHGAQNSSTLTTLYPQWLLVLAVQAILLTIIWLWFQGKRFGPIIIAREESVRFSDERIKALAAWYQRGKRYHDSIVIQSNYLRQLLQEHHGIPYQKQWHDITEQVERKLAYIPNTEIKSFIIELSKVLTKEQMSKQEFLLWSKKMDRFRKEVEQDEYEK